MFSMRDGGIVLVAHGQQGFRGQLAGRADVHRQADEGLKVGGNDGCGQGVRMAERDKVDQGHWA